MTDDLLYDAHRAAAEHLAACEETLFAEIDGEDQLPDSPASAPYCGCDTCQVREILHAAWPIQRRAALEGYPEKVSRST